MIRRYHRLSWLFLLLGAVSNVAGAMLQLSYIYGRHHGIPKIEFTIGAGLYYFGSVVLFGVGLWLYAKSKGRHGWDWGLFGLLTILSWVGWLIMVAIFWPLQDKTSENSRED